MSYLNCWSLQYKVHLVFHHWKVEYRRFQLAAKSFVLDLDQIWVNCTSIDTVFLVHRVQYPEIKLARGQSNIKLNPKLQILTIGIQADQKDGSLNRFPVFCLNWISCKALIGCNESSFSSIWSILTLILSIFELMFWAPLSSPLCLIWFHVEDQQENHSLWAFWEKVVCRSSLSSFLIFAWIIP